MTETDFCFLFDNLLLPQFGISHLEKHELFGVLNVVSVQSLRLLSKKQYAANVATMFMMKLNEQLVVKRFV